MSGGGNIVELAVVAVFCLCLLAPSLGPVTLLVILCVSGSTRWAGLPPRNGGLILLVFLALALATLADKRLRGRSRPAPIPRSVLGLLGAFVSWMALSLLWTPPSSLPYGAEKLVRLLLLDLLPAALLFGIAVRRPLAGMRWRQGLVLVSQGVSIAALAVEAPQLLAGNIQGAARLELLGTDPITLGMLAAIGLMGTFDRATCTWLFGGWDRSVLRMAVRVLCAGTVVATASKSILLGTALAVLVCAVRARTLEPNGRRRRPFRASHFMLIVGVAIAVVLLLPSSFLLRLQPSAFLPGHSEKPLTSGSVTEREALWHDAGRFFAEDPVAGGGLGSFDRTQVTAFGVRIGASDGVAYPHNIFLEVSAELGLVGVCLLALLAASLWKYVRYATRVNLTLATAIMVGATRALFTGDLSDHRVLIYSLAATAALYATDRTQSQVLHGSELVGSQG